ncbi:MAG: hypothetical protein AB4352_08670 [Hormoscilla sp.]
MSGEIEEVRKEEMLLTSPAGDRTLPGVWSKPVAGRPNPEGPGYTNKACLRGLDYMHRAIAPYQPAN